MWSRTVELIAIELPQFGSGKSRSLDVEAGANVADALSGLGVDGDPALLAMVNGEAVPRDHWPETPLSPTTRSACSGPSRGADSAHPTSRGTPAASWPDSFRPSTHSLSDRLGPAEGDARNKSGHDGVGE